MLFARLAVLPPSNKRASSSESKVFIRSHRYHQSVQMPCAVCAPALHWQKRNKHAMASEDVPTSDSYGGRSMARGRPKRPLS